VYLDFESAGRFVVPSGIGYAYIVAAATNYDRCEKDPLAYDINVRHIPRLVAWLLEQGVFVAFISTNSVFGGERPWPHEEDPHAPGISYARQKDEAEQAIRADARRLGAESRLAIVRLTKIMDGNTPPLPAWLTAWEKGESVEPFEDLIFAPMSVQFVGEALATVDLHLSGAENVSYVRFAQTLAARLAIPSALIRPTTATAKGVHIAFKPTYSGLGMTRTTALTGVQPQTLDEVVADLVPDRRA
jgi:dTDP-4-dehydrorhamnose reductase